MERFKVTEQPEEPEAEVDTPDSTDEPGQEGNRYTVPLKDADSPAKEKVEEDVPTERTGIPRTIPLTSKHTRTFNSGNHVSLVDRPVTPPTRKWHKVPASVPRTHTESPPPLTHRGASLPASPLRPTVTGTRYGAGLMRPLSPKGTGTVWTPTRPMTFGTGTPLCARCSKAVYFAEQVKANGRLFHKMCLRCTDCNTALDSSRLAEKGEKIVCRSCYSKVSWIVGFFDVSFVLEVVPCTDMLYNSCMGPKGVDMHFSGKLGLKGRQTQHLD